MCQHCKSGNVLIDEGLLDALIISNIKEGNLKPEDLKGLKTKAVKPQLTFKPDKDIGEGTATKEELEYRKELLSLLEKLYEEINKFIWKKEAPIKKLDKIEKLIDKFVVNGQKLVEKSIPQIWDEGIDEGLNELEKIDSESEYKIDKIDDSKQGLIREQQTRNIRKIGNNLLGRLEQLILINTINENKAPSKQKKSIQKAVPTSNWTECMRQLNKEDSTLTVDELRDYCESYESAFNEAQNNTDKAGMWGWLAAHREALLSALIMGTGILGDLIADWVTWGDDRVCDECLELEAKSPYSILSWPSEPHFGCRCEQQNVRLASLE
jgi:hypothetical protein